MHKNNYEWFSSLNRGIEESRRIVKPLFLFFRSETCFFCNQMDMVVHQRKTVADLIQGEFVPVHITPDTPDVFRTYGVTNVPVFVIAGTDGFEYERCSGFLDADGLMSFCLLALGKVFHDRNDTETAQKYLDRLISACPESFYTPEGIFLRGLYRYMTSQDPLHLRESFLMLAKIHPKSIWVKRSLIMHFHPSAVTDWEAYRKRRSDYWESQDAFVKSYATYYNGPSDHQIKSS
jgi:hypothetical protein